MRQNTVWSEPGMLALIGMTVAGFSGYALLMPVAPLWAARGGADEAGVGAVTGVFMLFTVLVQLLVPSALRRLGWTPVLVTGLTLLGAPALVHLISDSLLPVLALAAVRGAGFAVLTVCGSSAVAELVEPALRGRAIGAYGLGIAVPQLLLLPAAPWIAEHVSPALVFALASAPLVGIVFAIRLGRRIDALPPHPEPEHPHHGIRRYLGLLPPMLLLLGITLAGGALITFVPQFGVSASTAVVALLLLTALTAVARWGVGHIADRVGPRRILWPFVLVGAGGMALIAWSVAEHEFIGILLVGMALVGIAYGALQNLTLGVAFEAVPRRDHVVASAVWNIGFDAGTGLGAVVVGALASAFAFPPALLVAAGLTLLTLPLALIGLRRSRSAE